MIPIDVNVLVYAHCGDAPGHPCYRAWLESLANPEIAYGLADLVLSSFLRVETHPRAFKEPSPQESALTFIAEIRGRANSVAVAPGDCHWNLFTRLCREIEAKGNLVADGYLTALAIESGSEWITTDPDHARFRDLH